MPGAGKSTVGVILAKKTKRHFVDTDVLIQTSQGRALQDIVDTDGCGVLRKIEEDIIVGLSAQNHVIATGGSAVYSNRAMAHLKSDGVFIYLDVDLAVLESRIGDFSTRGLARRPDQSFAELFDERIELYKKYADITIKCDRITQEQICESIIEEMTRTS
jgi:shikimate kinase